MTNPYQPNWRDRLAVKLCNAILRTVATPYYRKFIDGAIRYGMIAAADPTYQPAAVKIERQWTPPDPNSDLFRDVMKG